MDSTDDALWFMGDLSDPWVVSIAEALARCAGIVQVHCPGDLPDRPFESRSAAALDCHSPAPVHGRRRPASRRVSRLPGRRRTARRFCSVSARTFVMKSWNAGRCWRTW